MPSLDTRASLENLLGSPACDAGDPVLLEAFPDAEMARDIMAPYVACGDGAPFPIEESRPVVHDVAGGDAEVVSATLAWTWSGSDGSMLLVVGNWSDLADAVVAPYLFDADFVWGSEGVVARIEGGKGVCLMLPPRALALFRVEPASGCGGGCCGGAGGDSAGCPSHDSAHGCGGCCSGGK